MNEQVLLLSVLLVCRDSVLGSADASITIRPDDPNISWRAYRELLVRRDVKDPPSEQNPAYCAYGNSTVVP